MASFAASVPYLQELSGRVRKPKLPQNTDLNLVADSGAFSTVKSISPLHLLHMAEFLKPFDHFFNNQETRDWGKKTKYAKYSFPMLA